MFLSLARQRRSIRKFKTEPVKPDQLDALIESVLRAPSSMGKNPWSFVIIDDAEQLRRLASAKQFGSQFVRNAPLAIVICADPAISDVWIEDASIATIFIQLAAASLGLGSCWVQIRERMHDDARSAESYIAELLNLPSKLKVESMVGIGYPAEQKAPLKAEALQYEKVFLNQYGSPFKSG